MKNKIYFYLFVILLTQNHKVIACGDMHLMTFNFAQAFYKKKVPAFKFSSLQMFRELKSTCTLQQIRDLYSGTYGKSISSEIEKIFNSELKDEEQKIINEYIMSFPLIFMIVDESILNNAASELRNYGITPTQEELLKFKLSEVRRNRKQKWSEINDNCQKVDLRRQLPEVYDQGRTNYCFAITVATMVQHEFFRRGITVNKISATRIALDYQQSERKKAMLGKPIAEGQQHIIDAFSKPRTLIGGHYVEAFNAAKKGGGVCLDSAIRTDSKLLDNDFNNFTTLSQIFPKINKSDKIAISSSFSNPWEQIEAFSMKACSPRIPIPSEIIMEERKIDSSENSDIEIQLGNLKILKESQSRLKEGRLVGFATNGIGKHAMIIVGQDKNPDTGMCEFIIRNSYGPNCGKGKIEGWLENFVQNNCDGRGHFRVPATVMLSSFSATYIINKEDTHPNSSHQKKPNAGTR